MSIRETRSKDLLVDLKCSKEDRGRLDTALKEVIGASGTARHLIPRIEVEIANIEPSIEAGDVENAVRGFFDHASELELKVSFTKRPYRGNRKVYVLLEEVRALKLLKVTDIKIGWVSCRVRQKMKIDRCYRCLGLATWRRTAEGLTVAEVAGGAVKRGTLRAPAQGNRTAIFAPLKKISPGTTISRGQYVVRLFGR